jgi:mRNA interferase RelE/StbE
MGYSVLLTAQAEKGLADLPAAVRSRVAEVLRKLADNPRPPGCKKLANTDAWRIRVGDYRIIYWISDKAKVVKVLRLRPRGRAYREH